MNNIILDLDMDSKYTQKMLFDNIWNAIFNYGFDYILDNGMCVKLRSFSVMNGYIDSEFWMGPETDILLMKAQEAAFDENEPDCYIIDMKDMSHMQMFDKIQDIISSRGFFNIFENGFQTKLVNRLYGRSKNNILYIGPREEQVNE